MYRFSFLENNFFRGKILFYFIDKPTAPLEKEGVLIRRVSQFNFSSFSWEMMLYFFLHSPSLFTFRSYLEIEFSDGEYPV